MCSAKTDGFTHLPPMRALVRCGWQGWAMDATQAASACGYDAGRRAACLWVDLSLPRCSIWTTQPWPRRASRSAVIGDRAFHADARVVTCWPEP